MHVLKIVRFKAAAREYYGRLLEDKRIQPIPTSSNCNDNHSQIFEELRAYIPEDLNTIKEDTFFKFNQVELLAPLVNPPKIICLGINYHDHATEQGAKIPDEPIIFMKPHTAITGPNKPIMKPGFVKKLDYEAELAIIISKRCKNISVKEAEEHIFGYTIFNDVSARDIQFKDRQWTRGKSFDTFAPIGPCIVTANQITDPQDLQIKTWVNKELRQDSTTKNMVFNIYQIIHQLSKVMTFEPGDLIATGTPAGVGFFMKPEPKFLKPNDIVTIEIDAIGRLENFVLQT